MRLQISDEAVEFMNKRGGVAAIDFVPPIG